MDMNKRVALLIGNSNYGDSNDVSGVHDAEEMKPCLESLGFEVLPLVLDGDRGAANAALATFASKIRDAGVALFFYSGHGFQSDGKNYLMPPRSPFSPAGALLVDNVLQTLAFAPREAIKFAFLDACRDDHRLPEGAPRGFNDPSGAPPNVLQCFAASPHQVAASGSPDGLSPYTMALLEYLREPGLDLPNLFAKVHAYVPRPQQPIEVGLSLIPKDFFFKPPVFVHPVVPSAPQDNLLVVLNGKIALNTTGPFEPVDPKDDFRLQAGGNDLVLLVSHGKTFRNGQSWERTEGWRYEFNLTFRDGHTEIFAGSEDVPFKDGPHHGKAFEVARAHIEVDRKTAQLTITTEKDVANSDIPVYAQDQDILFESSIVDLNLTADDILGDVTQLGPWKFVARPLLASILRTGELIPNGPKIADPSRTFFVVRGNRHLEAIVKTCVTDRRANRIRDLRASVAAAFNRNPRPFDLFDQGLNADVSEIGQSLGLNPDDLRVWTAIEDRSHESLSEGVKAATLESLTGIDPDVLQPLPGEFLLGPMPSDQVVQGVPISIQVYPFVTFTPEQDRIKMHARVIADLTDLQSKIGAIVDTIPLPTNSTDHFGFDNVVARIWGKQITIDGNTASLKLNGDVDVWAHTKNPIPCTRIVWDGFIPHVETFDCNPPVDWQVANQPFDATLPFTASVVDATNFALNLGDPSVNLGGILGGVTSGILQIAGVDINARVKEALDQAVNPEGLRQSLPEFLLLFHPVLTRAELVGYSGSLALLLEMDGIVGG